MPKINKSKKSNTQMEIQKQKTALRKSMYGSSLLTFFLALGMLLISFLFNGKVLTFWVELVADSTTEDVNSIYNIVDIILRSASVILFFLFTFISLGNLQELRGYVVTWKEMVVLLVVSLIQTTLSGTVFAISLFGIILILIYMYFIQGKIESEISY